MTTRERIIQIEVAGWPKWKQAEFRRIVDAGNSWEFALMAASRTAPTMHNCDRTFCEMANEEMLRMPARTRRDLQTNAKRAGIKTDGKFYCGWIGRPDDPRAWVTNREDAAKALQDRGESATGVLKVKGPKKEFRDKGRFLAPDLVEEQVNGILNREPKTREKLRRGKIKREALRDRVRAEHGPPR